MYQNFHPGDLRSIQLRDLPIISLWGNMKMLPVSQQPAETTQFFQDHGQSPNLWWSRCNWWLGVTERSPEVNEVTIRFSPITRDRMEIETRKWCHTSWLVNLLRTICILTYFRDDLTLTWPSPDLMWNFKIVLSGSKSRFVELARRAKHDGAIFIFVSLI